MTLGERLRLLRVARNFTQRELADAAGVTSASVSWAETGEKKPRDETVEFYAQALDVAPMALTDDAWCALELLRIIGVSVQRLLEEQRRAVPAAPVLSDAEIELERALAAQRGRRQADALPVAQGSDDEPITRGELRRILEQLGRSGESPGEKPEPSRSDHAADEGGKNGSRGGRR